MRAFLSLIILPLHVLYILLVIAFVFWIFNRNKTKKIFLVLAGIWFMIISTPLIPRALVKSLESKYTQLTDESIKNIPDSCDIIILGGGHTDDKDLSPNNQLTIAALGRLVEGIRIHNMIQGSRLVLSGSKGSSELFQALILYQTALSLGVDSASMTLQTLPSNTRMEAEEYAKNFGTGNELILVTDDIHMPRAMMLFKKSGLNPVAAPTNNLLKFGSQRYHFSMTPSAENIGMMEAVIHEYAGTMWAWAGGK